MASVCRVNVTALLVIGSTLWFDPDLRVVVGPTQDFSSDQQRPKPPHTPARLYNRPRKEKPC